MAMPSDRPRSAMGVETPAGFPVEGWGPGHQWPEALAPSVSGCQSPFCSTIALDISPFGTNLKLGPARLRGQSIPSCSLGPGQPSKPRPLESAFPAKTHRPTGSPDPASVGPSQEPGIGNNRVAPAWVPECDIPASLWKLLPADNFDRLGL